jgi:hypothetical protein
MTSFLDAGKKQFYLKVDGMMLMLTLPEYREESS